MASEKTSQLHAYIHRHPRLVQFLEYWIGGGLYFFSGYAVFALLYSGLHIDWLVAKIVADAVGWTLNFVVQRYWAFYSPKLDRMGMRVGKRYIFITLINFAIDYAIVATLKYLGVSPYAGMFISSLFFTVWNYLWYRFYVFSTASSKSAESTSSNAI